MDSQENEPTRKAMNVALSRLNRREHSRAELKLVLKKKGFELEVIDSVLCELERLGYVNDERCARAMVRHQLKRSRGPRYVQAKLKLKGLSLGEDEILSLAEAEGMDLLETARALVLKKYPAAADSREQAARAMRFLLARGFSMTIAREACLSRSRD